MRPLIWVKSMSAGKAHVRLLTPGAPRLNPLLEFCKGFPLKGLCHEMNNFFEVLKIKSDYFMYLRRWFLNFFVALLWRKWKFKFLLASMKTLTGTNFETPFKMFVAAACDSANCSESWR